METLGSQIWREILKNLENEKCTLQDLEQFKKSGNVKNETHKTRTWKMARKLKIKENETHTLQDLEYGKKKFKNAEN